MDRAETIGSGGFAKVKKAKHKLTGEKVGVAIPLFQSSRRRVAVVFSVDFISSHPRICFVTTCRNL
jgi:hypothetical protein